MSTIQQSAARRATLIEAVLNLLFPPHCVACNKPGHWLCPSCLDQIVFFEPPWPPFLDEPWPMQAVRAAAHLSGPLRKAIHSFKYKGLRVLADTFGNILYDCWEAEPWPVDIIVPVPLHPQRLRERGYNQSALLARKLGHHTALPIAEHALRRINPTPPQVGLNATQRAENVRDAFQCVDDSLSGLNVLLVDDVLTTGATLRSCAQALQEGNVHAIWGLTLARE